LRQFRPTETPILQGTKTMAEMTPRDRAKAGHSLFLRRMSEVNAGDVAQMLGWSDSKVSTLKNERMEECIALLAHVGIKLVRSDAVAMDRNAHAFITAALSRIVSTSPQLLLGGEE
jgi:hypothetical protein